MEAAEQASLGQRKVSHFVRPVVESSRVMLLPVGSAVKLKERQKKRFILSCGSSVEGDGDPAGGRPRNDALLLRMSLKQRDSGSQERKSRPSDQLRVKRRRNSPFFLAHRAKSCLCSLKELLSARR